MILNLYSLKQHEKQRTNPQLQAHKMKVKATETLPTIADPWMIPLHAPNHVR